MIMGRPFEDKKRIMGADGLWYYKCSKCKIYNPEDKMSVNNSKPFGVDIYCLECKRMMKKNREKKIVGKVNKDFNTSWVEDTGRHLNLKGTKTSDKMMMIQFFENMGYDTSKLIYKQFGERIKEKYGVDLTFNDTPYQQRENNKT